MNQMKGQELPNDSNRPANGQDGRVKNVPWSPILMYHKVEDEVGRVNPYHLSISTSQFEAQMKYLSDRGYTSAYVEDAAELETATASHKSKRVVITFDDGYADTYTHAFPILQKHGLTATVMLISSRIGATDDWNHGTTSATRLLAKSQIREMARHGIRFGSHSATHQSLIHMNPEDSRREIFESRVELQDLLGGEIRTFCYPFGQSNPALADMVKQAGYVAACGIEQREHTMFNLSRLDAAKCRGDGLRWRIKVFGIQHRLRQHHSLRVLKRGLTGRF